MVGVLEGADVVGDGGMGVPVIGGEVGVRVAVDEGATVVAVDVARTGVGDGVSGPQDMGR